MWKRIEGMRQPKDSESTLKNALDGDGNGYEKVPSLGYIKEERINAVEALKEIRCWEKRTR